MDVPDDDETRSQTETSAERQNDEETSSKDTLNPDEQVSMNALNICALEVNSADEIRQAVKAVLSLKALQNQSNSAESDKLPADTTTEETRASIPNEYKPESGDQLIVPKKTSTRKRRGRPQKTGPAKRMKRMTVEDFYVGKLSNVVNYPRFKRRPN